MDKKCSWMLLDGIQDSNVEVFLGPSFFSAWAANVDPWPFRSRSRRMKGPGRPNWRLEGVEVVRRVFFTAQSFYLCHNILIVSDFLRYSPLIGVDNAVVQIPTIPVVCGHFRCLKQAEFKNHRDGVTCSGPQLVLRAHQVVLSEWLSSTTHLNPPFSRDFWGQVGIVLILNVLHILDVKKEEIVKRQDMTVSSAYGCFLKSVASSLGKLKTTFERFAGAIIY